MTDNSDLRDEFALALAKTLIADFKEYGFESVQEYAEAVWFLADLLVDQRDKPYQPSTSQKLKFH